MQKLPLQPPYYDMAPSETTPFTDKPVSSDTMSWVQRSFSMKGSSTAAAFRLWEFLVKGETFCANMLEGI